MTTAACSEEETRMVGVVGYDEVALGAVPITNVSQAFNRRQLNMTRALTYQYTSRCESQRTADPQRRESAPSKPPGMLFRLQQE